MRDFFNTFKYMWENGTFSRLDKFQFVLCGLIVAFSVSIVIYSLLELI